MDGISAHLFSSRDRSLQPEGLHPPRGVALSGLSKGEESGIPGVEVKFVDIRRTTGGEGDFLALY